MTDFQGTPGVLARRGFLVRVVQVVQASIGGVLAFILGGAALAPTFSRREVRWLRASDIGAVPDDEPVAVTLRVARKDGASETVDRLVIYLVKVAPQQVRALDSTCTHLGCRTRFNPETRLIECPCHGGVYDLTGRVVSGPPPRPLDEIPARVDGSAVLVQV